MHDFTDSDAPPAPQVPILIVDDRRENILALEAVLAPLGQRLVCVQSGDEALAAVADEQFAVILMDIRMPGLDGFETMALVRRRERSRHVPLIFLSASHEPHDVLRSYSSGAVDCLLKPFDPDALRSKVSVFVHLRQNDLALEDARAELERRVAARTAELAEANRSLAREVVERKAAEERLYEMAFHDSLTGLANRSLFSIHLKRAFARSRRHEAGFAVMMMDVDRFKIVNDSLGHQGGDTLLLGVAKRLTESLREIDTVARLGGDEFAILLDGTADAKDATRLGERVGKSLETPFEIEGKEVFASASIGIAMMNPRYERAEDLLRDADAAMYRAKEVGGARCQVFDVDMHAGVMEQLQLEAELRRALERGELVLHYQPIVCLKTNTVDGVEALVRWRHPRRGLIGPAEFISLAEDTGLIRPIGKWVLDESCRQLGEWRQAGLDGLGMSVNVSARQFGQPELVSDVEDAAKSAEIELGALTLELTEGAVMPRLAMAEETLTQLRALGVSISLDDFGTGYSCLSYLHRFPVTALKIDRSFVSRIGTAHDNGVIVHTIAALAHNLKLSIVAEGVETVEQLQHVRALECQRAQGYLFAKPLEPAQIPPFIRSGASW